ncbi:MAG: peptidylprolyl isomerase [Oscillospiraceae bacterium]|nr:peptidylprolyl isomerase [Oscillospiraceae bacterium]
MKKRIIALVLTLVMALSLVGCGEKKMTEGTITEGLCYELTGISPDTVIAVVDGVEIPMDFYFYWLNYGASYMEEFMSYYGMELDWELALSGEETVLDFVRGDAMNTVCLFAVMEKMFNEGKLTVSEEAYAQLEEQRAAAVEAAGGEEAFAETVAGLGVRSETYDRISMSDVLYDAFFELYATEGSELYPGKDKLMAFAEEQGYQTADHILLATVDLATYEPLDEETVAQKRALAEELHAQLAAVSGEERETLFTSLADQYSEDSGRASNPMGYTFGPGEMVSSFEEGAAALAAGEISDIIESEFGYHIILKRALHEDAADIVFELYFSVLREELLAAAKVETNPVIDTLDIPAVYEGFMAAQGLDAEEEAPADTAEPAQP